MRSARRARCSPSKRSSTRRGRACPGHPRQGGHDIALPGGMPGHQGVYARLRRAMRGMMRGKGKPMSDDVHEIYAIKYGHHDRRAAENYIGGDPHDVNDPLDFFVWAVVGPHGIFVVDTGFDETMAVKRQRQIVKPVAEGLKVIGIAPDTVKDVIVSHLHYD